MRTTPLSHQHTPAQTHLHAVSERSVDLALSLDGVDDALAARLYTAVPYLFTKTTLVVALQMRGMARALGMPARAVVEQVGADG